VSAPATNNGSAWAPPSTARTRLVLVRHGVTDYSIDKRFAGRSDLPLTADGQEQARRAARRVLALGPVDAIVSSPLRRTRQTAELIAERAQRPVTICDGVIETDFGAWDGLTFAQARQQSPELMSRWLADPSVAPPGGEAFDAVTSRVRGALEQLLDGHAGETVALVSHVTPIKVLVRLALDAPPTALHRMFLAPAAISVVDYYADGPVSLQSFNDTSHL